jgi:acyl-CoA thioesterase-2
MQEVHLVDLMNLEEIDLGLYRGTSWDLGFRALFGGQVLGQALAAAQNTVSKDRLVNSFHSYFILPGNANQPVIYEVEAMRDGRSFSTRRVKAMQNGKIIFYMSASFQVQEDGLAHQQAEMPQVPPPEELISEMEFYEKYIDQLPTPMRENLAYHKPIEMRSVQNIQPVNAKKEKGERFVWMRGLESLTSEQSVHQSLLAYASDYFFLMTAMQPHGLSIMRDNMRLATIDHAMWFHRPIKFDDWFLYCMESPTSGGARGMVRGQIFNQQGELIASTMQEGLMRKVED